MNELNVDVDCIYIDPPFGLQKEHFMKESDGSNKSFLDEWESQNSFIEWYANIIHKCFNKLKKNGWLYCHNNYINNALVLSKLKIVNNYYTNISWKRTHPHNNIKNGWGNITDSILVFRKGNPYFCVEYKPLDSKYGNNSFNNKDFPTALSPYIKTKSPLLILRLVFNKFLPLESIETLSKRMISFIVQ